MLNGNIKVLIGCFVPVTEDTVLFVGPQSNDVNWFRYRSGRSTAYTRKRDG